MIYAPIYKDIFYEFTGDTNYEIVCDEGTVFRGKAYACGGSAKIYINRLCRDWLFNEINPELTYLSISEDAFKEFRLVNADTQQVLETYKFLYSWDYDTDWTGQTMCLSNPVNGHLEPRMYFYYTQIATADTTQICYKINPLHPYIRVMATPPGSIFFSGGTYTFTVSSNTNYEVTWDNNDFTVSPTSGHTGTTTFTVSVGANSSTANTRETIITFDDELGVVETFPIVQSKMRPEDCTIIYYTTIDNRILSTYTYNSYDGTYTYADYVPPKSIDGVPLWENEYDSTNNIGILTYAGSIARITSGSFANKNLKSISIPDRCMAYPYSLPNGYGQFRGSTGLTDFHADCVTGDFNWDIFQEVSFSIGSLKYDYGRIVQRVSIGTCTGTINSYGYKQGDIPVEWRDKLLQELSVGSGTIADYGFNYCFTLSRLSLVSGRIGKECLPPQTVNVNIGPGVLFIDDYGLAGAHFETAYDLQYGIAVGEGAFANTTGLGAIHTPLSMSYIPDSLFEGSSVSSLTLSSNVTSIGNSAFAGCSQLTEIYCNAATAPVLGASSFNTRNITFHYPSGSDYSTWQREYSSLNWTFTADL